MCVCIRVRVYACNVCVQALRQFCVGVLAVHGLCRNGFSQDGFCASIPLNGGNYTVSIIGERPHCLIAYLFINICYIRLCLQKILFVCCFVLYFVVYLPQMVKELFMLLSSTCVQWEVCSTEIVVLFMVFCAVFVSISCVFLCVNFIYKMCHFRANCAVFCVSFCDIERQRKNACFGGCCFKHLSE